MWSLLRGLRPWKLQEMIPAVPRSYCTGSTPLLQLRGRDSPWSRGPFGSPAVLAFRLGLKGSTGAFEGAGGLDPGALNGQ